MATATVPEVLEYSKLNLETVKIADVQSAIEQAQNEVDFRSPNENTSRSQRAEPLRRTCILLLATASLYTRLGPFLALSLPAKQILGTLNIQIGTDFPTPTDYESAFLTAGENYRREADRLLSMIASTGAVLR